ncbi:MAG: YbhN family protein [Actinobacteria bacterium]|jgi:uncharacterized protein (TIRG00374 family)|nr:YbhN family protein [Actinomycetota bacterium]MCL6094210.1 YbhN family protein [Actinomycetota bacterium]
MLKDNQGTTSTTGKNQADKGKRHRISRHIRWGVTAFGAILVLEFLVLPELAGARHALALLGKVNIAFLLIGVLAEIVALLAYAQLTYTVLPGSSLTRFRLFRIDMSTLALSHVLPGGTAPGSALGYRLLTESGVQGGDAAFALGTQGIGSAMVLNVIFWIALVISIPISGYNPLYGIAAIVGALLLAAFAGVIIALTKGEAGVAERVGRIADRLPFLSGDVVVRTIKHLAERLRTLASDRNLLVQATVWAAANWIFDATSLWIFLAAFGHLVSPIDLAVAYGLAYILAVIPVTPGGLGVVEGVLIPTLIGFGTPRTVAILGVLGYRVVNFWLPIPAGALAYLSLRFQRPNWTKLHRIHHASER